ncbi:hypothetical protein BJV74DRAFT_165440 [Russula compacta]|nr:hypothetical protein BJV74DRAFT_165440 [Russula compacta]
MNLYLGTRRPAEPSSSTSTAAKDDFPEALTYRYNDNSAWVPAAKTHEEAIDLAKHAYPELRGIRRDRITFHTTGKSSIACITPAAWQLVVRRLPPYHVVDVRIRDGVDGLESGDAELPEYSYSSFVTMNNNGTAFSREKELRYLQQREGQEESSTAAAGSGNRLSRMMSFVRGSGS